VFQPFFVPSGIMKNSGDIREAPAVFYPDFCLGGTHLYSSTACGFMKRPAQKSEY
jgi:hypothetical protein